MRRMLLPSLLAAVVLFTTPDCGRVAHEARVPALRVRTHPLSHVAEVFHEAMSNDLSLNMETLDEVRGAIAIEKDGGSAIEDTWMIVREHYREIMFRDVSDISILKSNKNRIIHDLIEYAPTDPITDFSVLSHECGHLIAPYDTLSPVEVFVPEWREKMREILAFEEASAYAYEYLAAQSLSQNFSTRKMGELAMELTKYRTVCRAQDHYRGRNDASFHGLGAAIYIATILTYQDPLMVFQYLSSRPVPSVKSLDDRILHQMVVDARKQKELVTNTPHTR